jgi:hypothetical protein
MSGSTTEQEIEEEKVLQEREQTRRAAAVADKSRDYDWLVRCAVLACVVLIIGIASAVFVLFWWGVPVLRDTRHAQAATFKALESGLPEAIQHANSLASNLDSASAKLNNRADEVIGAYAAAPEALTKATNTIGDQTARTGAQLRETLASAQKITDNIEPHTTQAAKDLEVTTGTLARSAAAVENATKNPKVREFVDDALDHGKSILAEVDLTAGNIRVISEGGKSITTKVDGTMTEVEALAGDSETSANHVANILGYLDDKVNPRPPAKGFKQKLKRGLLTFVEVLRDMSGAALVVFKIAGP